MKCLLGSRSRCWRETDTQPTELLALTLGVLGLTGGMAVGEIVVAQHRGGEQAFAHLVERGPPGEVSRAARRSPAAASGRR